MIPVSDELARLDDKEVEQAARELVIRTAHPDVEVKSLDEHVGLLYQIKEYQDSIDFWQDKLDDAKAQLAVVMGTAQVGTVAGQEAVVYKFINSFRGGEFKKQYPDLYRAYSREKRVTEFSVDWLRSKRPDLFREFQTRPMKVTYEPPGQTPKS